jgi:multidrug efflux pump subunit AcrA (membrane-fusion protein)
MDLQEGQHVSAGQPLATLTSLPLESDFEETRARLGMASQRAVQASLHYADLGASLKARDGLAAQFQQVSEMHDALRVVSPISGTLVTPRPDDLLGTYLEKGTAVLEVADLSKLKARIYISEFDLSKVQIAATARLQVQGVAKVWPADVQSVAARPTEMDPQLSGEAKLKGIIPPHFYLVTLVVENPEAILKPGMKGAARIYGPHRSFFALAWEAISKSVGRKVW